MQTQAEDTVSSQPIHIDKVLDKINEIAKKSDTGDYIYRGEPECYETVSSSLYREYLDIEAEYFDIASVQADILREAREYTPHKMEDFDLLATLQHHGDKTNLIDFTTDYLVALFFACDGELEEPGRVILLQRKPAGDPKPYEVKKPPRTILRAGAQKSIFVEAENGFVEPDKVVCIPSDLKKDMLEHLRKHHDISTQTIYNDLQGFIENRGLHKNVYTAFYKGRTFQYRAASARTEAERQECYNSAITHYTEAIDLNPEYARAYSNRGEAYRTIGNFRAAFADFNKAIALNPEDARIYNNRGLAYAGQSDFGAAIREYTKAITLNPEDARIYNNRGEAYRATGNFRAAFADFNKAIDLDPKDAYAYNNRGLAYGDQDEFTAAIEDYTKAIDLAFEEAGVYSNRGDAYRAIGNFRAAFADFNTAIDLNPEEPRVYNNRGIAYCNQGEFAAAIEDHNKAIDLDPEEPWFYINRGITYRQRGNFAAALEDFNTAIGLAFEDPRVYNNRGLAYTDQGDFDAAIRDYTKAIELDPDYAGAYCNRGKAWLHLKKWQEAKVDLTTAKDMGYNIIGSFEEDYESVEDFEAENGVEVPVDIAALLRRR